MPRPKDLPDFTSPPLNEVALGVQFTRATSYQQILAGEVWALFKNDFPVVEEFAPLPPTFETFGLSRGSRNETRLSLSAMPDHFRYWFLSPNGDELLQFQEDRLLHNWRKVGDRTNEYPRFDTLIEKFERELRALETFFTKLDVIVAIPDNL